MINQKHCLKFLIHLGKYTCVRCYHFIIWHCCDVFVFRCWSNTCNQFVKYIWLSLCKSLVEKREFVKAGINSEMYCFCFYINLIGVAFFKYNTDCLVFYFEQNFLNLINCIFACYYFLNKAFDVFKVTVHLLK